MRSTAGLPPQHSPARRKLPEQQVFLGIEQPPVDPSLPLSLTDFSLLTRLIYEGPFENPPWRRSLNSLLQLMDACHVTLVLRPAMPEKPSVTINASANGVEIYTGEYCQYEAFSLDPFIKLPADKVVTVDEIVGEANWINCEFYKQFVEPVGIRYILGVDIRTDENVECRLRVCRGAAAASFTPTEYALCDALLPHFKLAVHIHAHLDRVETERRTYAAAIDRMLVGTVILDESGAIMKTSGVAQIILNKHDGLEVVRGTLKAKYGEENKELQQLLKRALLGADATASSLANVISITRPSSRAKLGILVRSIPLGETSEGKHRPAVAVFLRDPERHSETSHDILRQLFGLTPAEASLSVLMANGLTLLEAAKELRICKNTARAHLRSIFSKTDVTRQTELVRLILSSVASLG